MLQRDKHSITNENKIEKKILINYKLFIFIFEVGTYNNWVSLLANKANS